MGMMGDQIVEPTRIAHFPILEDVRKAALEAGAYGATISGAGPTMIAVVDPKHVDAKVVAAAMRDEFEKLGVQSDSLVTKATGAAHVVEKE